MAGCMRGEAQSKLEQLVQGYYQTDTGDYETAHSERDAQFHGLHFRPQIAYVLLGGDVPDHCGAHRGDQGFGLTFVEACFL